VTGHWTPWWQVCVVWYRACLDQLLIAIRSRERLCDQQTRRSRSFQISQHLRQHLTIFMRHCAKTDHAESTHYGCTLQLYRIGVSRHCAQCVDSLCSYLGDRLTAHCTSSKYLVPPLRPPMLGQSGIRLNEHVKRRTLRVCVGLSDYRQQLQTISPGLYSVWDDIPGVATPQLHACTTDWTIKACLQSLYVSLGRSDVASATSTNCNRKLQTVIGPHSSC